MSRKIALFGLMALCACTTSESGKKKPVEQASTPSNLQVDRTFVEKAISTGQFEIEAARLALSRQTSPETTEFAQMMMRDHSQANDRLEEIADTKHVPVTAGLSAEHRALLDKLQAAQGEEFAALFQQSQLEAHREAIDLFDKCAKYCQDPDVRNYAAQILPTLRQHMHQVQGMVATGPTEPTEETEGQPTPEEKPMPEEQPTPEPEPTP